MSRSDPSHAGARAARRHAIRKLLHSVFGIDHLRDGQQRVIDAVLDGQDALAIMPTGSGKSLCYQIPARLLPGMTLVVSPLISLMKDQQDKLVALGVRAAQVNSSLTAEQEQAALAAIAAEAPEIVFCTPERLATPAFVEVLKGVTLDLVVIDEAHCISQWGYDFRPAYLEMAAAIAALGRPRILALTATATEDVVQDIRTQLGRPRMAVINTGIYRPNLHYRVIQVTNVEEKSATACRLVRETPGVGIVYAATVKAAEELYRELEQAGASVALYHGRLRAAERRHSQDQFMSGARRVMVATNAFGMGIDKPDTRFVLHLQLPANLEAYYQESGRAGRDGQDAQCILLYQSEDKRVQQFFLLKHYPAAEEVRTAYEQVAKRAAPVLAGDLDDPHGQLPVVLKLLKDAHLLRQNRRLEYSVTAQTPKPSAFARIADANRARQERERAALESMADYAVSGLCRWKLLLDYFGDGLPGFERCGTCDNCLDPPQIQLDASDVASAFAAVRPPAPEFEPGQRVTVPRYGHGTVTAVTGEQVTIQLEGDDTRTFMAEYVTHA
ncbi:MAG TPA: ATP-dependent DNA helicase RecQ [Telluria sp.]|nr:ATP-dependent DNA helicase RecQ [Telluria sp.]